MAGHGLPSSSAYLPNETVPKRLGRDLLKRISNAMGLADALVTSMPEGHHR